jgi:hypothetical protein
MPTKRTRTTRNIIADISETALWILGDRILYLEPAHIDSWEIFTTGLDACLICSENQQIWDSAKDQVLSDWIKKFPGTRPSFWWLHSAPRMSESDLQAHGWNDCFFTDSIPDLRARLGGIGSTKTEYCSHAPRFRCGIPGNFLLPRDLVEDADLIRKGAKAIDRDDPPRFESQATYLERHDLLMPGEKTRLSKKDYEPETISLTDEVIQ